jgi:CDP-diacylglycerol--serine O-phosphatidyltransferase
MVPSALTLLGLCCGATAIPFALNQNWKLAVIAIGCAMFLDLLDGRAARWLRADSSFGAQLDSLADLVSFGVAPAFLAYSWSLGQMGPAGWIAALIFCICSAVRLARFNIEAHDGGSAPSYFTGLPTPAAACILMLPLVLYFEFGEDFFRDPWFGTAVLAITSALMVSRLPTPSLKQARFERHGRTLTVLLTGVMVLLAVFVPWATLIAGVSLYLASIPFWIHMLNEKAVEQESNV